MSSFVSEVNVLKLKGRLSHTHYPWDIYVHGRKCPAFRGQVLIDMSINIDDVDCMHCLRKRMAGAFSLVDRMKAQDKYLKLKDIRIVKEFLALKVHS
jgi:hypothetical protein